MDFIHRAKKSLGQNFLKDKRFLRKVIETANLSPSDTVLEIGPGKGALTSFILESGAKLVAVEYDKSLHGFLQEKFSDAIQSGQMTLINKDILDFSPAEDNLPDDYVVVANIPYHITGAILRHFLANINQPKAMTLIMQKEVAERIVQRNDKSSILSLSVSAYGKPAYAGKIPAQAFSPKPKVDSAILNITNITRDQFKNKKAEDFFFTLVKQGFSSKRKQLVNNLGKTLEKDSIVDALQSQNLSVNIRAEDLNISEWLKLAKDLSN